MARRRNSDKSYQEQINQLRMGGWVALAGFLCLFIIVAALAFVALHNASSVEAVEKKDAAEARDADLRQRAAAWRGCVRDMYERSETYVSDQLARSNPVIQDLFSPELIQRSLDRRRARLPIIDCNPNLCNDKPRIMSETEQQRFINQYVKGRVVLAGIRLGPNPDVPRFYDCTPPTRDFRARA